MLYKKHVHCVLKFQSCGTGLCSVVIWVLPICIFILREVLTISYPLFDIIHSVLQGTSSR